MVTLEIVYSGSIDDDLDRRILREVGSQIFSRSYNPTLNKRNLQFQLASKAEAQTIAKRLRGHYVWANLDIFIHA